MNQKMVIDIAKQAANKIPRPVGTYFAICNVLDAFAHMNVYTVGLPAGGIIQATDISQGSVMPIGVRAIGGYVVGSRVLCCFDQSFGHAVVLGSVPRPLADQRLILPDSLVMRSRVGFFEDPMHYSAFNDETSELNNFSSGRPVDSLPGDWGYINELGVGMFIGKLMAFLKSSDGAKIETFWGDDLVRTTAYNYELFTAGLEDRRVNDEGEYNEVLRRTPYPWEGLGVRQRGTDPSQTLPGYLQPGSETTPFEPRQANQLVVPRHTIMRGYLGDIEREWVSAPPTTGTVETLSSTDLHAGLSEINKHSDGTLSFRSSKAILSEKYALIPIPKELIAPEDPLGDSADTGYQAAGATANIPDYQWSNDQDPTSRALEMYDYLAWYHNWYTTDGLRNHSKDWQYPEESAILSPVTETLYSKPLTSLSSRFVAPLPEFRTLRLDHRNGRNAVRYYQSRSAINQLDDGSIVIEDGYGSQLVMSGGNITMSAPGDVWMRPGRSFVAWAPFDAVLRAGNSAEISAANKDVRIKAEHNLHLLAGNSGSTGALLLESKSVGQNTATDWQQTGERAATHGVIIKCPKSSFHAMAGDVYIGCDIDSPNKLVCIDGTDQGKIYLRGQQILANVQNLFGIVAGNGKKLLAMTQDATVISTPANFFGGTIVTAPVDGSSADVICGGNLLVQGSSLLNNSVATNGSFAAVQGSPYVGKIQRIDPGPNPATYATQITNGLAEINQIVADLELQTVTDPTIAPGNPDFRKSNGFSCRDSVKDVQLDQASFTLQEARWQMLLRLGRAGAGKVWVEPPVIAPNGDVTMPHPGTAAWQEWNSAYGQGAAANFDFTAGQAKDRANLVSAGVAATKVTLAAGYKAIKTS